MRLPTLTVCAAALLSACAQTDKKMEKVNVPPPIAEKIKHEMTIHGDTRNDEYYWLNERENPKVIAYLEAENKYTDTMLSPVRGLRDKLFDEMKGRIKEKDESAPIFENGYVYYTRYEEGKEYPVYCRKKGADTAPEEIYLDVNDLAKGHAYFQLGSADISPDNKLLVFAQDTVSRRLYNLRIRNLETGEVYPETILTQTPASPGPRITRRFSMERRTRLPFA